MARQAPHSPQRKDGKVVSAVDWRGNRFAVGDTVIYCIGAGRRQMMAIGVVVQIKSEQKFARDTEESSAEDPNAFEYQQEYWRGRYYRIVHRPYDDVRVQVRTLKTSGRWDNEERRSPAWVNPMNITALKTVETA